VNESQQKQKLADIQDWLGSPLTKELFRYCEAQHEHSTTMPAMNLGSDPDSIAIGAIRLAGTIDAWGEITEIADVKSLPFRECFFPGEDDE
jgi:hypothetical protein